MLAPLLLLLSVPSGAGAAPAAAQPTVEAMLDLDAQTSPFPHYWKRCFGSGHVLLGTRADWREHMARSAAEIGVEGLRMHGVMDDDLSVAPQKGEYHFYSVDLVYDFMLKHGVKPIVELSFMPKSLVTCGGKGEPECRWSFGAPGSYRALNHPPDNWEDWYDLVQAMAQHMVDRHGLAEVSSWHWEVWNELWGMPYPHPYLDLYNASARAIKSVDETLRVGGPATAGLAFVQEFVNDTKAMGIPVDFVSTHSYPSDGYCSGTDDPECFTKKLLATRAIAQEAGYPFLITEYKDGLQGGPGCAYGGKHGDMAYAAAFILHTIPTLTELDMFSWWTISDVFEEGWLSGIPFCTLPRSHSVRYLTICSSALFYCSDPSPMLTLLLLCFPSWPGLHSPTRWVCRWWLRTSDLSGRGEASLPSLPGASLRLIYHTICPKC